jgi:hypothetical protein
MTTGQVDKNQIRPQKAIGWKMTPTHTCTRQVSRRVPGARGFWKKNKKFNQMSFGLTGPMGTRGCELAPAPVLTPGRVRVHPQVNF